MTDQKIEKALETLKQLEQCPVDPAPPMAPGMSAPPATLPWWAKQLIEVALTLAEELLARRKKP